MILLAIICLGGALPVMPGGDPPGAAAGYPPAPPLQLPWPVGHKHRIYGGNTYHCGTHLEDQAFGQVEWYNADGYAIDFQFGSIDGSPLDVAAAAGGTVIIRDDLGDGYGNKVVISHGGGYLSVYAHLASFIGTQTTLAQGDLLGYAGGTGGVPVHLHFHMMTQPRSYKAEPMSGWGGSGSNPPGFGYYGISTEYGLACAEPNPHDPSPYFTSGPPDDDGDGYSNTEETQLQTDVQGRCGPGASTGPSAHWPADLDAAGPPDLLNVVDYITFLFPFRPNDGHGEFNKFGHALDDDGDTVIEPNEDPLAQGGVQAYNIFRWNLQLPPHDPTTQINIADINNINPAVNNLASRPPMFNGSPAFFHAACTAHPIFGD